VEGGRGYQKEKTMKHFLSDLLPNSNSKTIDLTDLIPDYKPTPRAVSNPWKPTAIVMLLIDHTCENCGHSYVEPNNHILLREEHRNGSIRETISPQSDLATIDPSTLPVEFKTIEGKKHHFCIECVETINLRHAFIKQRERLDADTMAKLILAQTSTKSN
jgi:hypothetical protein